MKDTDLGSAKSIGDWMRRFAALATIAALVAAALPYEPWQKVEAFAKKVYTDRLKK